MAHKELFLALAMTVAAAPVSATSLQSAPMAPAGDAATRYCLRVAITGTRIDKVKCWTRQEWSDQEVDVDEEWAEEGVAIIDGSGTRLVKS